MRPYKRASLIAKSIIKLIEDGGGGSAETSRVAVLLPGATFYDLLRDAPRLACTGGGRYRHGSDPGCRLRTGHKPPCRVRRPSRLPG